MNQSPVSIQAVDRAFAALERLAQGPATLSAVSAHLGITLPGTTKILRTLEQHGLVRQTEGRGYALAAGSCRLAQAYCSQTPLVEASWAEMTRISLDTGHHSILAVMEGIEKVNLLRLDAMSGWRHLESQLPERVGPALSQATGRVLLAHVDDDVLHLHLAKYPLARFGGGLRDEAAMRRELKRIRECGHAVLELPDIRYIAAPVCGPRGRVVASLGAHAAPAQDMAAIVKAVCAAAARISAAYGKAP
ncbi:MAG: hypothetical protein A3K19_17710 [Lentisphaerae bacterium RIFOXYB12_FULL_65_16]|nr:MAG: hypothetical protein A3K18_19130 [Lentisphaerae bacterium RIFOXYA12_64_32]OGV85279.1 MAG: hypothetical protein A3K19_17710 [Lentisphaerae bacterium RIFOXYB12_FULL_65_16]